MTSSNLSRVPVRGNGWLAAFPFMILLIGAAFLGLRWDSIPDRWIVHWGANGQPNGWANKTLVGVFLPILVGVLICGFLELIALIVNATARAGTSLSHETARAIAGLTADFVRFIEITVSIAFVFVGLALPMSAAGSVFRIGWVVLALILAPIAAGMIRLWKGVRRLKEAGHSGLEGYNGIIYKNSGDARLWVPKISGLGYTLNFAHPWAWPIFLAILALPILSVVIALLSARS